MTRRQIEWASQHDWFINSNATEGSVQVKQDYYKDGALVRELIWFDDVNKLKVWAGY